MDSVADGETKVTLLRYCRLAHIGICAYQVRASCVAGAKGREMRSEKLNQRNRAQLLFVSVATPKRRNAQALLTIALFARIWLL
eukprot:6185685-Pleurochrysis_carterae.AAC.2